MAYYPKEEDEWIAKHQMRGRHKQTQLICHEQIELSYDLNCNIEDISI